MEIAEFNQRMEDALDYLTEQLEENPVNFEAFQFYVKQVSDINAEFSKALFFEYVDSIKGNI